MIKRIYLACPYTHSSEAVRTLRFETVTRVCAKLVEQGHIVYSPITHGHILGLINTEIKPDFEFHKAHCLSFLEHWATDFWVLTLDGWRESVGVIAEGTFARDKNLEVKTITPEEYGITNYKV